MKHIYEPTQSSRNTPKTAFTLLLCALCLGTLVSHPLSGISQSLESLKQSEAYVAVKSDLEGSKKPQRDAKIAFLTPYESLFKHKKSPAYLLDWLGCRLSGWKTTTVSTSTNKEVAYAQTVFKDKKGTQVTLLVQVPKPELQLLAKNSVLMSFKRLRPPFVTVVAAHDIDIGGISANYARLDDGSCTLHVPIEKNGLAHFQTKKCTDSSAMIGIAKKLNFTRLNGKLAQ